MKRVLMAILALLMMADGAAAQDANSLAQFLSPSPMLGAGYGLQIKERRASSEDLDDIKDMGVQYLRFGFTWDTVESTKGEFDWSPGDFFMKKLANRNFYVLFEVGGFNGAYSPLVDTVPNTPKGQGQQLPAAPTSPQALAGMERFIAETVRRYHSDHVLWEIWNEPDMNSNWPPQVDADAFAHVVDVTCRTIKRVDPQAVVVGPALAFFPARNDNGHENFLATILKSPAGACLDAVTVHPYRHRDQPPESVVKDYDDVRNYIAQNTLPGRKVLPIISSEWGYSTSEITPEQQAAYALRSFLINRLSGIPFSIWYEFEDSLQDDQTEFGKMEREAHFGIRDYGHEDKLAAKVVKEVLPHLLDARFESRIAVGDDKVYVLPLQDSMGRQEVLFWLADNIVRNPVGLQIGGASGTRVYPVGLIPTLVCTGAPADFALAAAPKHHDQEHYIPCLQ